MFFNKAQREKLNELSTMCFEAASKWQKLYNSGELDVPESRNETEEAQKYVRIKLGAKHKGYTVLKAEAALEKGLIKEEDYKNIKPFEVSGRKPTYEEIEARLEQTLRMKLISMMNVQDLCQITAHLFVTGELPGAVKTFVDPNRKDDYASLLERLEDPLKTKVIDLQLREGEKPTTLIFDALEFLTNVIFSKSHPDSSKEAYDAIFDKQKESLKSLLQNRGKTV